MSSNYQQKKMMNALGAIDTKGNIVLEQFQDGTALLFQNPSVPFKTLITSSRSAPSAISRSKNHVRVSEYITLFFISGSFLPPA